MIVEQIYTGCLAEAAYYIASEGEAVIIDPLREVQPYLERASKDGAKIKYILETHFHADFVSGHLDLAKKSGGKIVFGPNADPAFSFHSAKDGEELKIGKISLTVLHTPGHTMESTTYLLKDENGKEVAIFTGDTLFIGDVGRPDLAVKTHLTREDLAGHLFDSLRNRIMPLPDDVIVYPAHGAGSSCGKNMSKETSDTLGNQKKFNYALRADMSKEEFIKEVTNGLAEPPQYFPKNVAMNKMGYDSLDDILKKGLAALDPDTFEQIVNSEGALMLDTRPAAEFAKGHIPNAIFIGLDGSFATWVGTLITDLKQPIVIIAHEGKEEEAVTRLSRVGYDNTLGFLEGGMVAWKEAGKDIETIAQVNANELAEKYGTESNLTILDVRKHSEYDLGHLKDVQNFPLDFINSNMNEVDKKENYFIHCAGGYRSMIAASILKSRGVLQVTDVIGGYKAITESDLPKEAFEEAVTS